MKNLLFLLIFIFVSSAEAKKLIVKHRFPPKASCVDDSNLSILGANSFTVVAGVEFSKLLDCEKSEELKKAKVEVVKERNDAIVAFIAKHPKFKNFEADALKLKVQVGMPEELVFLMWGKPSRTNEARSSASTRKQLVFGDILFVYIEKGFVVAVQWVGA